MCQIQSLMFPQAEQLTESGEQAVVSVYQSGCTRLTRNTFILKSQVFSCASY